MEEIRNAYHPKEKRPTQPSAPPMPPPRHEYIDAEEARRLSEIISRRKEQDNIEKQKSYVMKCISDCINNGSFWCNLGELRLYPEVIEMLHDLGYKVTETQYNNGIYFGKSTWSISWEDNEVAE